MKTVVIAYDGTIYTYKWVKALMWAKEQFVSRGYSIQYVSFRSFFPVGDYAKKQIDNLLGRKKTDIIMLAFHHSISELYNHNNFDKIEILKLLHKKCDCLVWLDTADSTGTTQFEVLPYVDFYLKKQILQDKNLYRQHHYGQRIYLDYYHKKFNLDDSEIDKQYTLLDPQFYNKLRVSWNIGLADIWRKGRGVVFSPFSIKRPLMCSVKGKREIDVFFNGTIKYSNLTSFQRKLTCETISKDRIRNHIDPMAPLSHDEYIDCMKTTKIALSPFGWGEVCYRDFETIVYGAMLLKPSVEHMITYPNIYIANETYIPIDWDFSDYEEIMSRIDSKEFMEIAQNAQDLLYKYTSTKWGKEQFADHIIQSIA
jgi:hypothetical protein